MEILLPEQDRFEKLKMPLMQRRLRLELWATRAKGRWEKETLRIRKEGCKEAGGMHQGDKVTPATKAGLTTVSVALETEVTLQRRGKGRLRGHSVPSVHCSLRGWW